MSLSGSPILHAKIRMLAANPDKVWTASAGMLFELTPDRHAGAMISFDARQPDQWIVGLKLPGDPVPVELARAKAGDWVDITVQLKGRQLTAWSGGRSKSAWLNEPFPTSASYTCSSGKFEFQF